MPANVYLSGPRDVWPTDWKTYAIGEFIKSGITVANPIELDLKGFLNVKEPSSLTSVKHSLNLIDKADSLLANLFQITEPTLMEIFYAARQGKQVVVIGAEPFSPWVLIHSEARFKKLKEALDYLVRQRSTLDTITWSTQFETDLKKKGEQYPPEGELDFEYYGGELPVLVLAPHSTSFFKEGNYFSSESYTGTLAVLLHKLTSCHALIHSYCMPTDPVYHLTSPLVNFLRSLIKKINLKLVIVLHGQEDRDNKNELILTTRDAINGVSTNYLNLLTSMLKIKDFKQIGFDSPELTLKNTKTINHLFFEDFHIPTIGIEIHKRFRLPQLHPTLYSNLYTSLAQFLMLVGAE